MMHDQPGLDMTDPLVDPRTVLRVPQELTTAPKSEPQMRTQPEELSPEKEKLLTKLREDHQYYLEMSEKRLPYLQHCYNQQIKQYKTKSDDQLDRLLEDNCPLDRWQQHLAQQKKAVFATKMELLGNFRFMCMDEKRYEDAYFSWATEQVDRQEALFQQYQADRIGQMPTRKQLTKLGPHKRLLVSVLLRHTHCSFNSVTKATLCRIFRIAGFILSQRVLSKLHKQYRKRVLKSRHLQ